MQKTADKKLFEKSLIGFVSLSVVALAFLAVRYPHAPETLSPQADLKVADAEFETASGAVAMVRRAKRDGLPVLTVNALLRTFTSLNYDLDQVRAGAGIVPRHFVSTLPADMRAIRAAEKRKALFFKTVLPLVLKVNNEIAADRARLKRILSVARTGQKLPAADRLWIAAKSEIYKVKRSDLQSLLARMDIVPPSLALAQAAEESGWGTSRFVLEGNALFGQWTFSQNQHLVPRKRADGKTYQIRAFPKLIDAVRAYTRNLNTHRAYREFRATRATQRAASKPLSGIALADTLTSYSERGEKYVRSIRILIASNRLQSLDGARLGAEPPDPRFDPSI